MDQLEQFIKNNREEFDCETPSMAVWHRLQQELDPEEPGKPKAAIRPHRRVLQHWMSIAAMALFLVAAGAYFGATYFGSGPTPIESMAEIAPEYGEMEQYYRQTVAEKRAKLVNYEPDAVVLYDLEQLDAVYEDLKQQIQHTPESAREQVVEAMIENYRARIGILEQVLKRLETTQNTKATQDEITI